MPLVKQGHIVETGGISWLREDTWPDGWGLLPIREHLAVGHGENDIPRILEIVSRGSEAGVKAQRPRNGAYARP